MTTSGDQYFYMNTFSSSLSSITFSYNLTICSPDGRTFNDTSVMSISWVFNLLLTRECHSKVPPPLHPGSFNTSTLLSYLSPSSSFHHAEFDGNQTVECTAIKSQLRRISYAVKAFNVINSFHIRSSIILHSSTLSITHGLCGL